LSKIKVLTTVASWPEALGLQRMALSKYLAEEFELIGIIDTPTKPGPYNLWDINLRGNAIKIAKEVCDRTIVVPEEIHFNRSKLFRETKEPSGSNANLRAADSLQFAYNNEILENSEKIIILDNDMFPISNFSWEQEMQEKFCKCVVHQSKGKFTKRSIDYLWSGLMFLDASTMPYKNEWSFDCGKVKGIRVDVSGQTYHWYKKIKENGLESGFQDIIHLQSLQWSASDLTSAFSGELIEFINNDDRNINSNYYTEFYNNSFIHFRAGSNWNKESALIVKNRINNFTSSLTRHINL
jgi:hypothetical protein